MTSLPESISDEECSICLSVLMRPVTLACKHEFCARCLEEVLQKFSFCPICQRDLESEIKSSSTDLTSYVNQKRWDEIQSRYPERVQRRSTNEDTEEEEDNFEFAISQSKLHFEEEQKKLMDSQVELPSVKTKPEKKPTKRKRNVKVSTPTTKAKVVKQPPKPRAVRSVPKPKAVKAPPEPPAPRNLRSSSRAKVGSKPTDAQ